MTKSIDTKIVQMAFENDKFEKGVGTSLSSIDKLKKSLNFDNANKSFAGISDAANRVNLGSIADGVQGISNKFSALGILAITTLVNIANSAYQAGITILKALTIDPVKMGYSEFELKMGSIQTIMSGTGESLEAVNKKLDELNTYSDKTIYSFADMTTNIGKFTNAGVSLNAAVAAIQGVANVAALAGSNANEASRAMYNFGQAISSGSVKLMDWKSIELANMATKEFKQQIIDTAIEMGTIKKVGDDMYQAITGGEQFNATKMFNQSLEQQWFTAEVLTDVLGKYADETTEIGKRATAAAQDVKTLSMLYDTLKEAAQSGWAQTWELIVGDFEEGKTLFTSLSNFFGGILGASADARNSLLTGWKDIGGRTKLLEALKDILNGIVSVINPIVKAFRDIFPATTAQQLFNITEGLAKFAKGLTLSSEMTDKVRRIFKGLFALLDIGKIAIGSLLKALFGLVGSLSETGTSLLDLVANFGDWLVGLREAVLKSAVFTTIFENIAKVIKVAVDGVTGFFSALFGGFSSVNKVSKSESVSNFLETIGQKFKDFGKFGVIISKVFNILSKLAAKLGPIVGKIATKLGEVVNKVLDSITASLDKLDINKVLELLNTGLFGGILLGIKGFVDDSKKLVGTGLFGGILLSIKSFIDEGGSVFTGVKGILDGVKDSLKSYQKTLKAETLMKIAGAMALLAASILVLSFINSERLLAATSAMGAMFIGLMATLNVFEKTTGDGRKLLAMTGAIIGISGSLLVLAGAITILGKLDPAEAAQGVLAVGSVFGLLILFQKFAVGSKGLIGAVAGIFALSLAMMALGLAIRNLGGMDTETLLKGLLAMGAALGIISVGLNSMGTTLVGSASLLVASAAILVLAGSLKALGALSLEQLGMGLLAIAAVFTVLGVAGYLLTPVAPIIAVIALSLLAIGAAAGAFGLGILAIGAGLAALAIGIVTLASLSSAGIAAVTLVISGIAALIPMLATQAAKGLATFIVELSKSAVKIGKAIANIGLEMLKSFATVLPEVITIILDFVKQILIKLEERIPDIVETGAKLLIGFLEGIKANIGTVTGLAYDIVVNFIDALASRIPALAQSGWNFIISWIDGVANAAETNIPRLMESVRGLGLAIVKGIVTGWIEGAVDLRNGIIELGRVIIDGFKNALGINSPSTVFIELAKNIIDGLINGILSNVSKAKDAIVNLATTIINTIKDKVSNMVDAGRDFVLGFTQGIQNFISEAITSASNLASAVINAVANTLDAHSPARALIPLGKSADEGLALGITKFAGKVTDATKNLGNDTISGFGNIISRISDSVNSNIDANPTIRPVIDLTDIKSSGTEIDKIFGDKSLNLSSVTAKAATAVPSDKSPVESDIVDQAEVAKQSIQFTQINNSPKELSRYEIYRQTQNQLSQLKGLVGEV